MAINIVKYRNNTLIDLTDTTALESDVASGKKLHKADGTLATGTASGGGGGIGKLLNTTSLGSFSTSSTTATDTGKTLSVSNATDYDILIVEVSVDSVVNGRHLATVSYVHLSGTSNVGTKNTVGVVTLKWNCKASSSGTKSSRQGTTAYGIYANSGTISGTSVSIPLYIRYNSTSTGTINNTYTARVYGVKLVDLIGG